jgi:acetyl esterase/lipase
MFKLLMMTIGAGIFSSCMNYSPWDGAGGGSQGTKAARIERDVAYGTHSLQRMDVHFPANYTRTTPVVFLIHGGAFVSGTKEDFARAAHIFCDKGFIVANLSHRLADTSGMYGMPPVHHKSTITVSDQAADVAVAVMKFRERAEGWDASTDRLYMAGHSAGGTLALLYSQGEWNKGGYIKACGNWAGVTDLTIPDDYLAKMVQPYVRELLYRVSGADPMQRHNETFKKLSPYWIINDSTNLTPTISIYPEQNYVFHYPGESQMGLKNTKLFHEVLRKRGVAEKLLVHKGSNHSFNFSEAIWDKVIAQTADFFLQHGK